MNIEKLLSSAPLRWVVAATPAVLVLLVSALAFAGGGVHPSEETSVPGGTLMVIGYLVLWGMLGGFLFFVLLRQRRLQDEVDELERRIDESFAADGEVV